MPLKTYRKKRNFKKTPEPKGKYSSKRKIKNLYIIQKHAASHLHYDFRLELNGVLLSWAVPKGPSLDPTVKRLAIHVEDHPLQYGSFEGTIPKGQYGGGTVMLWDKGAWFCDNPNAEEAYRKGDLTFQLKAKKLNGGWKLVRINNDDKTWLLMKLKDSHAKSEKKFDITVEEPNSVTTNRSIDEISINHAIHLPEDVFPKMIYPELATLVDKPPSGKNWLHEIKFDGYRLIVFKQGKKVRIFTRNQHDWTSKFKKIATEIGMLPVNNLILDGEVVALDENQHSDFQLLQNAIKEGKTNLTYYIFDLIYYDKFNLTTLKLIERKSILQKLLANQKNSILRYSDHVTGSGKDVFKKTCELGLEGIVSKDANSIYAQKRDKSWLKTKCIKRQEFVIGGFHQSTHRDYFRSLMLGTFNKNNELIYHGNVGTGFTEKSLKSIYSLLSKHITNQMPFKKRPPESKTAIWVKPVMVAEIEFTEWTDDDTLRHPSFKGIRSDKPVKNVIKETETPVKNSMTTQKYSKQSIKNPYNLTHPDKLLYPEGEITKQEVVEYYAAVQKWILPYISNRPLTLLRCPENYKKCFFQKHIDSKLSSDLYKIMIQEKSEKSAYLYLKNRDGLLALPQLNVLEIHTWGSRVEKVEYPDIIVFDLDPAPGLPWKKVVDAAFEIKKILADFKLKSFVKTTGGKGLHVTVPVKPEYDWDAIKTFSKVLVDYLVLNHPKKYVGKMAKSKRKNKIFVDYLRNQRGATFIAPYSTRARKHAPIATPVAWDELTHDIRDTFFTIKTLPQRLDALKKDPWGDFFKIKQSLHFNKL